MSTGCSDDKDFSHPLNQSCGISGVVVLLLDGTGNISAALESFSSQTDGLEALSAVT